MFACTKSEFGFEVAVAEFDEAEEREFAEGFLRAAEEDGLSINDGESDSPWEYPAAYTNTITLLRAPGDAFDAGAAWFEVNRAELEELTQEDEEWAEISA